ncbi:MAG: hypothetical protein SF066_08155 [Thermoanaerobaculia bacterium]|nr:hypothetical protein [Thermoanaerobaculia bacterium]
MSRFHKVWALATTVFVTTAGVHAEGYAAHVTTLDPKASCLAVEWDNGTERKVCWTEKTKFAVLETGKAAKATDVRVGSFLRMEGDQRGDTYWASEIVIWEAVSRPPSG